MTCKHCDHCKAEREGRYLDILPGVEITIYQGANGNWYASVLLDHTWPQDWDLLPHLGTRPFRDSGSGRWWYDIIGPERDALDEKVADLVVRLAGPLYTHTALGHVQGLTHRAHRSLVHS